VGLLHVLVLPWWRYCGTAASLNRGRGGQWLVVVTYTPLDWLRLPLYSRLCPLRRHCLAIVVCLNSDLHNAFRLHL